MDNRFSHGFRAGLIASIFMNAFNLSNYYLLHSINIRYLDWSSVMLYGERPDSSYAAMFALLAQIIFTCFISIIYAYLTTVINDGHYLFKGWLFGVIIWFLINGIDILMKLQPLEKIPPLTSILDFIGASIYGLVLGYCLFIFNRNSI
ncbi:MAG: hypothetical protein AAGU27_25975 [Dehalobacterium sp.]